MLVYIPFLTCRKTKRRVKLEPCTDPSLFAACNFSLFQCTEYEYEPCIMYVITAHRTCVVYCINGGCAQKAFWMPCVQFLRREHQWLVSLLLVYFTIWFIFQDRVSVKYYISENQKKKDKKLLVATAVVVGKIVPRSGQHRATELGMLDHQNRSTYIFGVKDLFVLVANFFVMGYFSSALYAWC